MLPQFLASNMLVSVKKRDKHRIVYFFFSFYAKSFIVYVTYINTLHVLTYTWIIILLNPKS